MRPSSHPQPSLLMAFRMLGRGWSAEDELSPRRVDLDPRPGRARAASIHRVGHPRRPARRLAARGQTCAHLVILLTASVLHNLGLSAPYAWFSSSTVAILAGTISLFIGIPVAIAMNL